MNSSNSRRLVFAKAAALAGILPLVVAGLAMADEPVSYRGYQWTAEAPRDEIRPKASFVAGGVDGKGSLVLDAAGLEGSHGWWQATVPVTGGKFYRFSVLRKTEGVEVPRRSAYVRIEWRDEKGRAVNHDEPGPAVHYNASRIPRAEPEYPTDKATDPRGWTELSDTYHVPTKAVRAIIELYLIWTPGRVEYSGLSLQETSAPAAATFGWPPCICGPRAPTRRPKELPAVRAIYTRSRQTEGRSDRAARIAHLVWDRQAAGRCCRAHAGPSTRYFGELAKKYDMYIVAGLTERDGHLIYNTAA